MKPSLGDRPVAEAVRHCLHLIHALIGKTTSASQAPPRAALLFYEYWHNRIVHQSNAGPEDVFQAALHGACLNGPVGEDLAFVLNLTVADRLYAGRKPAPPLAEALEEAESRLIADVLQHLHAPDSAINRYVLGAVGYFGAGTRSASAEGRLPELVQRLCVVSASPYRLPSSRHSLADACGNVSLGLERGLVGVLGALIKAYRRGVRVRAHKAYIRAGVRYLLSLRRDIDFEEKRYAVFPESVASSKSDSAYTRALTWSNSDLGCALLLYQAGQLFNDAELTRMADLVGLNTLLRRTPDNTLVTSSEFAVGSTGVAYAYYLLFRTSSREAYLEGYWFWLDRSLKLLEAELASGHYQGKESGVMDGLLGVALVLLGYCGQEEPFFSPCLS